MIMIDKRAIETVLADQQEELEKRSSEKLCRRAEEQLVDLNSPQAQVVIGVRRSGKSTLCYQALHNAGVKFAYVNFDDEHFRNADADDLDVILEVLYKLFGEFEYLFLDEIQNIGGWHLFVNKMLRRRMHIVMTGSNARLLSGELATHLTGRCKEIPLYPFSFSEYCSMKNVDTQKITTQAVAFRRAAFDDYMKTGGFPELLSINSRTYVNDLVNNILKRDIGSRFKIRFKASFGQMAQHLLNIVPAVIVDSELARLFHFKSEHTVRNYIDYLKQAYLLIGVNKFSAKSRIRVVENKVYPVDVALMNQRDNAFAGDNLGWRLETIVFLHLQRTCKLSGYDIYYMKERSGECDFLICRGNRIFQAIQVSYDISNEKTRKRELSGLLLASRITGCRNLLLLTDHEYDEIEAGDNRIIVMPVYDWVLRSELPQPDVKI